MYDQVTSNKRRSRLLVAAFVAFVALVAVLFSYLLQGGVVGVVLALVIAVALSFGAYWKSDAVALRVSRAGPPRSRSTPATTTWSRASASPRACPSPGST